MYQLDMETPFGPGGGGRVFRKVEVEEEERIRMECFFIDIYACHLARSAEWGHIVHSLRPVFLNIYEVRTRHFRVHEDIIEAKQCGVESEISRTSK